jgi:uncharacterized membrane protein
MDSASASLPRSADSSNPAVEALVVALTIAPFILLAAVYSELPDPLPVHVNIRFEPDGWAPKGFRSVFAVPLIGVYLQGLFLLIKQGLVGGTVASAIPRFRPYAPLAAAAAVAAAVALVVVLVYFVAKLVGLKRRIASLRPPASAPPDRDEANWRGGGLFYYNPSDPALFVEKRFGVGYTFNFGNRRAWLYMAYIVGLPILIGWVAGVL